jgi:hypothetical protein
MPWSSFPSLAMSVMVTAAATYRGLLCTAITSLSPKEIKRYFLRMVIQREHHGWNCRGLESKLLQPLDFYLPFKETTVLAQLTLKLPLSIPLCLSEDSHRNVTKWILTPAEKL